MPLQATIEIDVDAAGVISGSTQAETAFNNTMAKMRTAANSTIPATIRQTDELNKTLNRMANSRAPQLMGSLTAEATRLVPGLQNSAAAMGLMSTASFSLQRALNVLIGPTGAVVLMVSALGALAIAQLTAGQSTQDLISKAQKLTDLYVALRKAGIDATGTQMELARMVDELKKRNVELIEEMQKQPTLSDKMVTAVNKLIPVLGKLDEKTGLAQKSWSQYKSESEEVTKRLLDMSKAMDDLTPKLSRNILDAGQGFGKTFSTLEDRRKELIQEIMVEGGLFYPGTIKDLDVMNLEDLEEAWKKVQETMKVRIEMPGITVEAKRELTEFTKYIKENFQSAFAEMLRGGKVAWDELLKYWLSELLASEILNVIGQAFSGQVPGFIAAIGGILGLQSGTSFVPRTGAYVLHQGEAVIPANRNPYISNVTNNTGGNTYIIQVTQTVDEDMIREKLLPSLRRMAETRELGF